MDKTSYVYIIGNNRPTLYIGVTTNLEKRIFEHTHLTSNSFAQKYGLRKLLYIEAHPIIDSALAREKQLKGWHRQWKLNLIKQQNPDLVDLWSRPDPETSSG